MKAEEEQAARTKSKAEVFTPSWVVCYMNNKCDDDWFGRENVFNTLSGEHWESTKEPVYFKKERDWQRYVDSRRLEITCGEAPYLVSRYDAATGEELPIENRIGILDRKLRVVNEMSYEQIADVLDIQIGTVKSRLSRARNQLKKILERGNLSRRASSECMEGEVAAK